MIVFVNPDNKTITICDKTVKIYNWNQFNAITTLLQNKEVIYVTEVVETTGEEVLNVIYDSLSEEDLGDQTSLGTGEMYFHATCKGKVMIVYNGKEYTFKGIEDMRPLDSLPAGMLENCRTIIDGVKSGLFEIINEYERKAILEDNLIQKEEKKKKNNMVVEKVISAKDLAAGVGRDDSDNATVIELGSGD